MEREKKWKIGGGKGERKGREERGRN